jgi:hypothetical protein
MSKAFFPVKTLGFQSAVAEHLGYLSVFYAGSAGGVSGIRRDGTLTVFFEDEFAFFIVVFVFASSAIFTSFAFILWLWVVVSLVEGQVGGRATILKGGDAGGFDKL